MEIPNNANLLHDNLYSFGYLLELFSAMNHCFSAGMASASDARDVLVQVLRKDVAYLT